MFTPGHTPGCISMLYKPSKVKNCCHVCSSVYAVYDTSCYNRN